MKNTEFPGFCDVHVHLREPGYSYKETILTGTKAAAHGGYTCVCSMPNLNPVPDSAKNLKVQTDIIKRDALIDVRPYASITIGEKGEELVPMEELKDKVIAFSDDGNGIQNEDVMRAAMTKACELNKIIVAHCEVKSMLHGGYINEGLYARSKKHLGISNRTEYMQVARDLRLAKETGCAYHVCHVSTKESVDLIRRAKDDGVNVTCETAPHYLVLDDSNLQEDGRFKMNPPLRSSLDRLALIKGIKDGTIDMIATDHAPHSAEEKSKGLANSAFGIVGLEIAFPLLYTKLVRTGVITLDKLIELMSTNPRVRFGIPFSEDDRCVWDLEQSFTVNPEAFYSKGKATPFEGETLYGVCLQTIYKNSTVYSSQRKYWED